MSRLGWMHSPIRDFTCAWCGKANQTRHHSKTTCDRKCLNKLRSAEITQARREQKADEAEEEQEISPDEIDRRFAAALRAIKGKYSIDPFARSGPDVFSEIENILDC